MESIILYTSEDRNISLKRNWEKPEIILIGKDVVKSGPSLTLETVHSPSASGPHSS